MGGALLDSSDRKGDHMARRRALVCGASQGIGESTARTLASQGVEVTLWARSADKLKHIAQELSGEGHDVLALDINQTESWQNELKQRVSRKPYDIVILNSGGPKAGPIQLAQPSEFISAMGEHLVANALLMQILAPAMIQQKWGRVVTVTSTSVKIPIPNLGVSNTVRAAVASWAKTLSVELAPYGVTVNNVMPGYTETPRLTSLIQGRAEKNGHSFEDETTLWKAQVPMGRFARPEETAALIAFLSSEVAGYITGQNIAVDGGRLGCL